MKLKKLTAWLMALVLMLSMAPSALAVIYNDDEPYPMYVSTDKAKVNLYSEMSTKSKVLTKVPNGKKVTVYSMIPGSKFADVSYKGYYGYVLISNLSEKKPTPKPTPKPDPKPTPKPTHKPNPTAKPIKYEDFVQVDYYVQVSLSTPEARINMRWQPSTDADVVGIYPNGSYLKALMESKNWVQVMDENTSRVGYMSRKYLVKTEQPVLGTESEQVFDSELVVSPMNSMDSLEALSAAMPGLALSDAPEGYEALAYDWINGDPLIAQVLFGKEDELYCYRAAHCQSLESAADIDGIYTEMHEDHDEDGIHLCLDDEGVIAVAHYFSPVHQAQYSLTGSAADGGEQVMALARIMFPAE